MLPAVASITHRAQMAGPTDSRCYDQIFHCMQKLLAISCTLSSAPCCPLLGPGDNACPLTLGLACLHCSVLAEGGAHYLDHAPRLHSLESMIKCFGRIAFCLLKLLNEVLLLILFFLPDPSPRMTSRSVTLADICAHLTSMSVTCCP